jgi:hypothetical protein
VAIQAAYWIAAAVRASLLTEILFGLQFIRADQFYEAHIK